MSSIVRLTRRFVGILCLSILLLLAVNVVILIVIAANQTPGAGPWTVARETGEHLQKTEEGYFLPEDMAQELKMQKAWAIYIENETMQVVWHTDDLPEEIPMQYTISDISALARGYLKDYPTFTGSRENGLIVVGFPKDRYWKHMNPSWDYSFIKNLPYSLLAVAAINAAVIFLIYLVANSRLLRSVKPIANGVQALPTSEPVRVREKGLLSDLARDINQTAEILQTQRADLRKKESARANWISGVSHDIRTPLSMVLGYAGQLEESNALPAEERRKAAIIRQQSLRIKNLINDLNLASKLEYNMQPLRPESVNLVAVARQCAVDSINADLDGKYPIEWNTEEHVTTCIIQGDKSLLRRAVNNVLNNARSHNPDGCHITMEVQQKKDGYWISVEDDGAGVSDEQLERLRNTPHYMMSDSGTEEPRHGLGLLIVQQIVQAHRGSVDFGHSASGGFQVKLHFPF